MTDLLPSAHLLAEHWVSCQDEECPVIQTLWARLVAEAEAEAEAEIDAEDR